MKAYWFAVYCALLNAFLMFILFLVLLCSYLSIGPWSGNSWSDVLRYNFPGYFSFV